MSFPQITGLSRLSRFSSEWMWCFSIMCRIQLFFITYLSNTIAYLFVAILILVVNLILGKRGWTWIKVVEKKIGVGWVLLCVCVFVHCVWECWSICYCVYRALYRAQRHRVFCFHSCILEEISNFIHITCGWILMRLMVVCLWLLLWMWSCACTRWTLIQIYFCHMKDALTCNERAE